MTIVKIKNPVLRWLVGLIILATMAAVAAMICYGIGCVATKIPFFSFAYLTGSFSDTIMTGLGLLVIVGLAVCIGATICIGAYELGNKFFDM